MEPDFAALRREFPLLQHKTYLNSGSYCALANGVRAAFDSYLQDRLEVGANWDVWVEKNEAVRTLMARVLHATPDEIAVTASASAGLNALASAIEFSGGRDKVVVSDFEFPTNAQIWHSQEQRGARVVHARRAADGYIPPESFAKLIDEQTRLVAITHVCFRNGARLDIPAIVRLARAKGAMVLLDCYQSVGSIDIDVKALDVDFAVGGMLKYLLGTAGIGFLYVRDSLVRSLHPTHSGWFAQENIFAMDITANRPSPSARRFESGTPPVVNCYATEAGLTVLLGVGTPAIERRIRALTKRCMESLREIGWPSITPAVDERRGAMVCIPSRASGQLSQELLKRDIVTSNRDDNLRVCLHFYNNDEDVDVLVAALRELREQFAATNERRRAMAQVTAKGSALLTDLAAGILGGGIRVVDLTVPLEPATPTIQLPPQFAPSKPFALEEISRYDQRGPAWYWNNIACGEHTGTHFDAPIHWVTGKDYPNNATHNIPVQKFIGPACVIDVTERVRENVDFLVTVEVVKAWEQRHGEIPRGAWVLIRTEWSKRAGAERFLNIREDGPHTPGFHPQCVPFLAKERDILGVGVETVGTDAGQAATFDPMFPCHTIMHGSNRFGLASLMNLDQLPATGAIVIAPPLKIVNGSGSPLRVLALVPA